MSLILLPSRNRVQEIVYQTILPYYDSNILEEYNKVKDGIGNQILEMIEKDIVHLEESMKKWQKKLNMSDLEFEKHLSESGYNVSGKYKG